LRCILLTPMETDMSTIDKDLKTKVTKPSGKKFFLGFSDAFFPHDKAVLVALAASLLRRGK